MDAHGFLEQVIRRHKSFIDMDCHSSIRDYRWLWPKRAGYIPELAALMPKFIEENRGILNCRFFYNQNGKRARAFLPGTEVSITPVKALLGHMVNRLGYFIPLATRDVPPLYQRLLKRYFDKDIIIDEELDILVSPKALGQYDILPQGVLELNIADTIRYFVKYEKLLPPHVTRLGTYLIDMRVPCPEAETIVADFLANLHKVTALEFSYEAPEVRRHHLFKAIHMLRERFPHMAITFSKGFILFKSKQEVIESCLIQ